MQGYTISKNNNGTIKAEDAHGNIFDNIRITRAFPISDPENGFSIVDSDGHELVWFESISELTPYEQSLVRDTLSQIEFIPVIQQITGINTFSLPSLWDIQTDRGPTRLKLKSEQDIRRISDVALLITDADGIQYLMKNRKTIDKQSKKILDRFL
ncbi:cyanophycin metabolism-associated DUF1854 family protein [Polynucleobacter kasalickyi]|uniref:DUF1854 domain-containing protein n=1 Tax=Polynucleobacter kasalickyi TaxID=1938817 RepID=A0A1W1ZRW9_9BURK|nr:DUF1854 domain-containing protein [Polynucleobacter kasalickyi]SMC50808.1 protein of unknown function [Polynucleobacter kasalickyi]